MRPDDAGHAEEVIEEEEQRDVHAQLPDGGEGQRDAALAEGLHIVYHMEAEEHHDRREAARPEIDRAEGDGLLVVDERAHDLRREGPVERDAHRRHGQPGAAGDAEKGQHPLPVAGGKIVRDERHHGQADAHADVQRQALDLQNDAHCGQLDVAVAGGELVDDDVRQVVEQEAQRRGHADGEDGPHGAFLYTLDAAREGQNGLAPDLLVDDDEIDERDEVGQQRRQCGTEDFVSFWQEDEHEQRVEPDVQKAAEAHAEAGLLRIADVAEHRAHRVGQQRRQRADDDDGNEILPRVADRIFARAEQIEQRVHERKAEQGEDQCAPRCHHEAERRGAARLVLLTPAEQLHDQIAAAHAEEVGKAGDHQKHRRHQCRRRDHVGVIGLADEPGVGQIVDQHDQLADDRRHGHNCQRLKDRRRLE